MQSAVAPRVVDTDLSSWSDTAVLDLAEAVVRRLQATTLAGGVDDEALRDSVAALARCESGLHAEKLRRIDAVAVRAAHRAAGHRSAADWVADVCAVPQGQARRLVATADAMSRMPATAARLADGSITPGHADAAARGLADLDRHANQRLADCGDDIDASRQVIADADATTEAFDAMVAAAAGSGDRVALHRTVTEWTAANEPDTIDARDRRALAKRGVYISDTADRDGLYDIRTRATATTKAQLLAALDPLAAPTNTDDDRTLAQRRHDALATLAAKTCDTAELPTMAAQRPHLLLVRRPTTDGGHRDWLDGVGPVSSATAALIACDAHTTTVTIDTNGRVWDVGRADGDPTTAQRKAVIARDTACIGCGANANRCHLHHIQWRSHNGKTTTNNLTLVCWACHHNIHHLGWQVERTPDGFTIRKRRAD